MEVKAGERYSLYCGDCMEFLDGLEDGSVDLILTDPPYSSGGLYSGDRKAPTSVKYIATEYNGAARFKDFTGDNMDQHSFQTFTRMVLFHARAKTVPGGICAVFTDWRQLPAVSDALQGAGWIWRGIVVWNKGNSRAIPYRFRNDCEYIVWGTNGRRGAKLEKGVWVLPGCYNVPSIPSGRKHHQTEKPVELLKALIQICPEGGLVCDPFMGSGSAAVAALQCGRRFTGSELDADYFQTAVERAREAESGGTL